MPRRRNPEKNSEKRLGARMKPTRFLAPFGALLTLVCAFDAAAGVNGWTHRVPLYGGGPVTALAMHPNHPDIALIGTRRGVARTTDAGDHWTLVKNDTLLAPSSIVYDPSNLNRVVMSDGLLVYVSEDGGVSYAIAQGPSAQYGVSHLAFGPDGTLYATAHGGRLYRSASPFGTWTEITTVTWPVNGPNNGGSTPTFLTVDPDDSDILYVGINESGGSTLTTGMYRSTDGGGSWTPIINGIMHATTTPYNTLSVSPADSTRLLAATGTGVWLSTDSGSNWTQADSENATWAGFDPDDASIALALNNYTLRRSSDSGDTWAWVNGTFRFEWVTAVGFRAGAGDGILFASAGGIMRSSGSPGYGWEVHKSIGIPGSMTRELAASNDGTIYTGVTVGPYDIFRLDGSVVFAPLPETPLRSVLNGYRQITSIAVSRQDSRQIFAVNAAYELVRTFDRGSTWTAPHAAFTATPSDSIFDVQIDPSNDDVAYVARINTGVWKTENAGATFARLTNSPTYVNVIGVSPHNSQVLYAGGGTTAPSGIYKSTDGGQTWTQQYNHTGTANYFFNSFAFHPTDPNVVYATAWGGVFRTGNGGTTWSLVDFGPPNLGTSTSASAVLFDPLIPTTITMVAPGVYPGFLRSVDGGATWEFARHELPGPFAVLTGAVLDPHDSAQILATTTSADLAEYRVAPDLVLTAPDMSGLTPSSSTVPATFTVRNDGPHASSASELVIDFPSWITPSGTGCTLVVRRLTCRHGALRVDESHDFQLQLAVGPGVETGQITATLTGHEQDMSAADNFGQVGVNTREIADLEVAMSGGPQSIDRGQDTNVSVTVANSGPSPSTSTFIDLRIPAHTSMSNLVLSQGACGAANSSGVRSCNIGTIATNGSVTLTFTLTGTTAGQEYVSASVSGNGIDVDGGNSAARSITVLPISDMRVALTESADPVTVDSLFQYTATITNDGPDTDEFQVVIPVSGAVIFGATSAVGGCSIASNTATCVGVGLSAGSSATVTVELQSDVPGIATATATVSSFYRDTDTTNNSATIGTTMRLVGDVSVEITDNADPVAVGASYDYIVTTRNSGPNAGPVQVVIPVANANISAATSTGATCTRSTSSVTCNIASLPSGGGTNVIVVTVAAPAAGTASASASATFAGVDTNAANNTATASTLVRVTGDIGVTVTDSVDPATAGTAYNYTVTVSNTGPNSGAVNVSVPVTGATVTGTTLNGGTCTNTASTVTCDIPSLVSNGSAVLTINVNAATAGAASAAATVTFSGTDLVATNNAATANTAVNAAPVPPATSPPRSGGGGGGRFDWLFAGLLGLLVMLRQVCLQRRRAA
jgi:hypothetical protein